MVCTDQQKQIHELGEKLEVTNSHNISKLQIEFSQLNQNLETLKKQFTGFKHETNLKLDVA